MNFRTRNTALAALPLALGLVAGCGGDSDKKAATPSGGTPAASSAPPVTASPAAAKNGVEKLSADQILKRANKAMKAAPSMRMKGKGTEEGQAMTMDLQVRGTSMSANITMGKVGLQVIRIGATIYIKGDAAFYASFGGAEAAKLLNGKYIKGSAKAKDLRELASLADPDELLKPEGKVTKGELTNIDGRPAIVLIDGSKGKLYVATEGEPRVLAVVQAGGKDRVDVTYEETAEIKAPPADQTIDAAKLSTGG